MDDEAIVADVRVRTDGGHSEESVLFEQQIQGVRVLGGGLRVVLRDGAVVWTTGRWLQAAAQVPEVWVSGTEARWLAWNAFPGVPEGLVGWPRLVWYSPFTAQSPEVRARDLDPRRVELAWETRVGGESDERGPSVRHFVISAESGEVLESWGVEQYDGAPQEVWDFELEDRGWRCSEFASPANLGHPLVCDGSQCAPGAEAALANIRRRMALFSDHIDTVFGHSSFDGQGRLVRSMARLAPNPPWAGFRNPGCDYFGFHGELADAALIGHEYGHGIIGATAGLRYVNSSGAANEAFAELWGGISRKLDHGTSCERTCPGVDIEPNTLDEQCYDPSCGVEGDNGGVHSNRNILAYAGELMWLGGTHPDRDLVVEGIGTEAAERLWYDTLALDLRPESTMVEACFAMTARSWRWSRDRVHGFDPDAYCAVNRSCNSSGLVSLDPDCGDELWELVFEIPPVDPNLDTDGDQVPDEIDNCPEVAWTSVSDLDDDGSGDACDEDADGDGLLFGEDVCPLIPWDGIRDPYDSWQCHDTDGDGYPNGRDPDPGAPTLPQSDRDSDGLPDVEDLCDVDPVLELRDSDGDGAGDRCDLCVGDPSIGERSPYGSPTLLDWDLDGLGNPCDPDADGDGVDDLVDNCPRVWNPGQEDANGDGVGWYCDINEFYVATGPSFTTPYEFVDPPEPALRPLSLCEGADCLDLIGESSVFSAFTTDQDVGVAVMDSFGAVVAWMSATGEVDGTRFHGAQFDPDDRVLTDVMRFDEVREAGVFAPVDVLESYQLAIFPLSVLEPETTFYGVITTASAYTGPVCGNGRAELGELCDGPDLRSVETCADVGWLGAGQIRCAEGCADHLVDACTPCVSQLDCETSFGTSCLADGSCGYCVRNEDCRPPYLCQGDVCQLN